VLRAAAGLTQMLDYYAGNSYDDGDSVTPSSRAARSTTIQVGCSNMPSCMCWVDGDARRFLAVRAL
jgi:hypothetical protein